MRKVVQLRGLVVQHHLILADDGVHLIDGGFIGGISRIKKALDQLDKELSDIRSIILTHGHLDHTFNVAQIQKLTGCRVYAPFIDREHVEARHRYRGWSRLCGWLEKMGRILLPFQVPKVDQWFSPGDTINGLKVIALPGHTRGHCGLLLPEEKVLLAGDLFAKHFRKPSPPPRFLNDDHQEALRSINKAAKMDLKGVMLNHASKMTPAESLSALIDLADDL